MPRRGAIALLLTTLALALLLSFKTPAEPSSAGIVADAGAASPTPAIADAPAATVEPATGGAATVEPATEGAATATPESTAAATTQPPAAATATYRDGTVAGTTVETRYGPVQVQVTISGGVVTDVVALQLPTGDHHSAEISQRAEPVLRSAALAAQGAEIDVLSGATYTSLAYAQSLQAALDSARA